MSEVQITKNREVRRVAATVSGANAAERRCEVFYFAKRSFRWRISDRVLRYSSTTAGALIGAKEKS